MYEVFNLSAAGERCAARNRQATAKRTAMGPCFIDDLRKEYFDWRRRANLHNAKAMRKEFSLMKNRAGSSQVIARSRGSVIWPHRVDLAGDFNFNP
jgi:hypothetical protein